jgi:hypothetical protein
VKRGLVAQPDQWKWSSFRYYAYGEEGLLRTNRQEWKLEIKYRPVTVMGDHTAPGAGSEYNKIRKWAQDWINKHK